MEEETGNEEESYEDEAERSFSEDSTDTRPTDLSPPDSHQIETVPGRFRITDEMVKEMREKLCLIDLSWPEIDTLRLDVYAKTQPERYFTVCGKERLLAWYAENFRRQFQARHTGRAPLLLMSRNECGVQRFVSTAIRRSTLPYPELYTWQGCGKFVSDYIDYEPLDKPLGMPSQLRSPTWMLSFQRGNSFECATLLTSLLLGQGYNAFVVSGYASKEQTECDLTMRPCPYLEKPKTPTPRPIELEIPKYKLKLPPDLRSQFQVELENAEKESVESDMQLQGEEQYRTELDQPPHDNYHGSRVHGWVVILPEYKGLRNNEISRPIFIEPSTGVSYKPTDPGTRELYFGVESIWNDQNYWVNVQPRNGCEEIKWDLCNVQLWEHLLPGEPWTMRGDQDQVEEEIILEQEKHLDMPASYVKEIQISAQDFDRRYPNGTKTRHYEKAKVELFAPYVQTDGMIQRITLYEDYDYSDPVEVNEKYSNRSDNLIESRRSLEDDSVVDRYKRGRLDRCKEHRYFVSGSETVDSERILDYYNNTRADGLSRMEMHPEYLTQHYENREDLLYYRQAEFSLKNSVLSQNDIHYRQIWKITEKFHRNETVPACKDVAIREFAIGENEIRLMYHYYPGRCSRGSRVFVKPPLAERGDRLVFDPSMMQAYNPDPLAEPEKSLDLFYELEKHLNEEDLSVSQVRVGENEVQSFLVTRRNEYLTPGLLISPFDEYRDVEAQMEIVAKAERQQVKSQRDVTEKVDYLKPYMARIGNPSDLPQTEVQLLRQKCLNDYKQLLVRRANNILRKFEDCAQELAKTRALLQQGEGLTKEEEEQILEKMNEINFNLHTLEIRLNRHKEQAPKRYRMVVENLEKY